MDNLNFHIIIFFVHKMFGWCMEMNFSGSEFIIIVRQFKRSEIFTIFCPNFNNCMIIDNLKIFYFYIIIIPLNWFFHVFKCLSNWNIDWTLLKTFLTFTFPVYSMELIIIIIFTILCWLRLDKHWLNFNNFFFNYYSLFLFLLLLLFSWRR